MSRSVLVAYMMLLITVQLSCADDLALYDGTLVGVPPNVLVLFDNSDGMLNCPGTNNQAINKCNDYVKLKVVRDVLEKIFESDQAKKLRLGLMSFVRDSNGQGGKIHLPCGASSDALKLKIKEIGSSYGANDPLPKNPPTNSLQLYYGDKGIPLGEALAEAGRYFAGKGSAYQANWTGAAAISRYSSPEKATVDGIDNIVWYTGSEYVSPISATCQKNYVVILTSGEPRLDDAIANPYIAGMPDLVDLGRPIPNALRGFADSTMFDDVASYLYNHDFSSLNGTQNIETAIIGFDLDPDTTQPLEKKPFYQAVLELMKQTAKDGNGGVDGNFYTVDGVDTETIKADLIKAFTTIFENVIAEVNSTYVAPVIPVNPDNRTDVGNRVYMGFFKPQTSGRWVGNLKAYGLINGILQDSMGAQATIATGPNAGIIKDTAQSYWSTAADGLNVDRGGAGEVLSNRNQSTSPRKIYTFIDDDAGHAVDLTNASNQFALSNNAYLTPARFGLDATDILGRNNIVNNTLAKFNVTRDDKSQVDWLLGDIVHSEPFVKYYENLQKAYLFVGANDGMLHVFDVADNIGQEVWAFVPPGQLSRLGLLTSAGHDYFVDGSPVIETVTNADKTTTQLLIFGERRGGDRYYALDVSNPEQPKWKYQIHDPKMDWDSDGIADNTATTLGQSWAKPQLKKVKYHKDIYEAFLLAGGYDEHLDTQADPADCLGRAIYAVKAGDGMLFGSNGLNINAGNWKDASGEPYMTHSILDATGFDKGGLGYMDRLYAGDLGGHMFAARYNICKDTGCTDDFWASTVLFDLTSSGLGKKIMTRPEVTLEPGKECVYFGTGDRENPNETVTVNAIYAVCNTWNDAQPERLTINNLVDVSNNYVQQGTSAQQAEVKANLATNYGWYMRLPNPGEKLVSAPKLLNKKLYFATFTPGSLPINGDPCVVPYNFGVSRLYAVDYLTGAAAYNFNADMQWSKEDRSKIIGTSIAGEPVLTTSGETTSLYYGSGGKFEGMPVETSPIVKRYYWRQLK